MDNFKTKKSIGYSAANVSLAVEIKYDTQVAAPSHPIEIGVDERTSNVTCKLIKHDIARKDQRRWKTGIV